MKEFIGFRNDINFGGWFSQCDYSNDRFYNFIKDDDFRVVESCELDHIRIPLDYNLFLDDKFIFIEDDFNRIHNFKNKHKKK